MKEAEELVKRVLIQNFGLNLDYLGGNDSRLYVLSYDAHDHTTNTEFFDKLISDLQSLIQKSSLKVMKSEKPKKLKNNSTKEARNHFEEFINLLSLLQNSRSHILISISDYSKFLANLFFHPTELNLHDVFEKCIQAKYRLTLVRLYTEKFYYDSFDKPYEQNKKVLVKVKKLTQ